MASSDRNEKPPTRSSTIVPTPMPSAVSAARFPVSQDLDVLFCDLDPNGHVNNARYFGWLEEARFSYLRLVGIDLSQDAPIRPVLASTTMDFLRPIFWPERVRVEAKMTRIGRTSLTMDYRISSLGQQAVVATASAVVVLCLPSSNRPAPIPESYRDAIRKLDPDARETL